MADLLELSLSVPEHLNPNGVVIRTAGKQDDPLFCLSDVCSVLGNANHRQVSERLDEDEVHIVDAIDSLGRKQPTTFVTESGLYHVALTSRAENATPFRQWVTKEVLPCIRKHGCYPAPAVREQPFDLQLEVRRVIADELSRFSTGIRFRKVVPPGFDLVPLLDPRDIITRFWPDVSKRRMEDILGMADNRHRSETGRPLPKEGPNEGARRMIEIEHVEILTSVIAHYWRKDHPGDEPYLLN